MKKIILFLLCAYTFLSCSPVMYYVYDEDGSREGYPEGYCTFEVNTKKKKVYYRGYSEIYADPDRTPHAPQFVYMESTSSNYDNQYPILFNIDIIQIPFVAIDCPDVRDIDPRSSLIITNKDKTALILVPDIYTEGYLTYEAKNDSILLVQAQCANISRYGKIDWFPPYLKKARGIDYNRFMKKNDLHINYKEPFKTKKKK